MDTAGIATTKTSSKASVLRIANRLRGRLATVRSYAQFKIANALLRHSFGEPRVVVDLDRTFPDIHDRRYFFLILQTLLDAGYRVDVVWKISFGDYRRLYRTYEGFITKLRGVRIVARSPEPSKSALLFTNRPANAKVGWKKIVELDCDVLAARDAEPELVMPYFMHPEQYKYEARRRVAGMRANRRRLRILFSGNLAREDYQNPLPGDKLTRFEIAQALQTMSGIELPTEEKEFREMFLRAHKPCVIHDRRGFAVADANWLETIAQSDFFLCLPGSRMPLCHNVIEAMAVGTIPILNYGEWLNPPLRHGDTCIGFNTLAELRERIEEILNLDENSVERFRQNVINYYEEHASPRGFRQKLEELPYDRIKLVVNTAHPWETQPRIR